MISVENVSFYYSSGVEALKNISIEIGENEFIAIMGENGAGKTTLVKHLNGILKPTKGNVYVNGLNTKKQSVAELSREVGLVFQNPDHQLFCETVEEEIAFGLRNFGFSEKSISEKITWVLEFLDLKRYRMSSPFMLSGGERKRVALAAVLAWNPSVVVLDEPTIGQDYAQKDRLRRLILQLHSQGKTIIMVTHDVEFVADCNPKVVMMADGRILANVTAKEGLTDYELVSKASLIPPQITQLFHKLSDLDVPQNVIDLHEAQQLIQLMSKRRVIHEGV